MKNLTGEEKGRYARCPHCKRQTPQLGVQGGWWNCQVCLRNVEPVK